jgi:hypothetical protein
MSSFVVVEEFIPTTEAAEEQLKADEVKEEQKKLPPSGRALVLNQESLHYAMRVYEATLDKPLNITVSSERTTVLDVADLPDEFLSILLTNAHVKLSAKAERVIRKQLGDFESLPIKTIQQLSSTLQLIQSNALAKKMPAFELKIENRWYPVAIPRINMYESQFVGKYIYVEISYSIADQAQSRRVFMTSDVLKDESDPIREKNLTEILESQNLRICTTEAFEAHKASMSKLKDYNSKPGMVLLATTSVLSENKFLWMSMLTKTPLGTPNSPKIILVEPELEVENEERRHYLDDSAQVDLPFIRAFSLTLKKYVYLDVNDVQVKQFAEGAVDRLHLPDAMRSVLVKVFTAPEVFGDMFSGRHGGMVILANGTSGVGKTLTAEVFAEMTKRPLYTMEMGELGTNLDQVEKSLQRIFARAARWNAVLLFDEADIFLSKRTESDLERSAIVGVFLRLLDQYEGMFFLTTNRAEVLDPAIDSRITLRLDYPSIDDSMRAKIWNNMLQSAGITVKSEDDLKQLAAAKALNGRQVRNQVRLLRIMFPGETVLGFEQLSSCLHFTA